MDLYSALLLYIFVCGLNCGHGERHHIFPISVFPAASFFKVLMPSRFGTGPDARRSQQPQEKTASLLCQDSAFGLKGSDVVHVGFAGNVTHAFDMTHLNGAQDQWCDIRTDKPIFGHTESLIRTDESGPFPFFDNKETVRIIFSPCNSSRHLCGQTGTILKRFLKVPSAFSILFSPPGTPPLYHLACQGDLARRPDARLAWKPVDYKEPSSGLTVKFDNGSEICPISKKPKVVTFRVVCDNDDSGGSTSKQNRVHSNLFTERQKKIMSCTMTDPCSYLVIIRSAAGCVLPLSPHKESSPLVSIVNLSRPRKAAEAQHVSSSLLLPISSSSFDRQGRKILPSSKGRGSNEHIEQAVESNSVTQKTTDFTQIGNKPSYSPRHHTLHRHFKMPLAVRIVGVIVALLWMYLSIGSWWNSKIIGRTGWDSIPKMKLWREVPCLITDFANVMKRWFTYGSRSARAFSKGGVNTSGVNLVDKADYLQI